MSLFSNSYKYYAYAASSRLYEEPPKTVVNAAISAMIANASVGMAISLALGYDLGKQGQKLVKYAADEDGYIRGLPEGDLTALVLPEILIKSAIELEIGEPIDSIIWMIVGNRVEDFLLKKHIDIAYTDSSYFPWGVPPSNPIWDEFNEFVEIPVIDPDTGNYYVTENIPIHMRDGYLYDFTYDELQSLPPDEYALLQYKDTFSSKYRFGFNYTDINNVPQFWESPKLLDLTAYELGKWIQVKYNTVGNPDNTSYWTYLVGSDLNPALEASIREYSVNSYYMPVAIMMQDKVWFNEDPTSQLAITTNKLLKRFNLKGDRIREDFEEQEAEDIASGDANKKLEKWDFFIHWAVPVTSKIRGAMEYMYEFFLEMEKTQQYSFEEYQTYLASANDKGYRLPQPVSELHIQEGNVNGYNVRYGWSYIYSETFPGRFEELGQNKMHSQLIERLPYNDVTYKKPLEYMHGPGLLIGKTGNERKGYHDYVIFTRQHYDADTDTWTHTRVLVMALSMEYTVNTRESGPKGYRFRYAEMGIFDRDDDGDLTEGFRLPINIGILQNNISRIHEEEVISEGAAATVLLVYKQTVKWYTSGFFKWLIIIIAITLIVLSIYYAGGAGTETLVSVIIAALGVTSATLIVVLTFVITFAIGYIIALAGSLIGGTAGMIFTIIGTYFTMMYGQPGVTSAYKAFQAAPGWGTAASLVNMVGAYTNMGMTVVQHQYAISLEQKMKEFMLTSKEKYAELQAAWDALGEDPTTGGIEPLDLMRALAIGAVESVDSYLSRTLMPNPGLLSYELITNYNEIAMNLPQEIYTTSIVDSQMNVFARQRGDTNV